VAELTTRGSVVMDGDTAQQDRMVRLSKYLTDTASSKYRTYG